MERKPVCMIVARAEDGGIGRKGKLPWDLPDDRRRFREVTEGCPVIAGYVTWKAVREELAGAGRTVILLGRGHARGHSVEQALHEAQQAPGERIWVIGGAKTYRRMMPEIEEIDRTTVHGVAVRCDRHIDDLDPRVWRRVAWGVGPAGGPKRLTSTIEHFVRAGRE